MYEFSNSFWDHLSLWLILYPFREDLLYFLESEVGARLEYSISRSPYSNLDFNCCKAGFQLADGISPAYPYSGV